MSAPWETVSTNWITLARRHKGITHRHKRAERVITFADLVVCFINTHTFAAMDFGRRPGASDEHIPKVDL
jgi:hypothetical protein